MTEGNFHQLVALLHCRGLHKVTPVALPEFFSQGSLWPRPRNLGISFLLPVHSSSKFCWPF